MKVKLIALITTLMAMTPGLAAAQVITPSLKSEPLRALELELKRLDAEVSALESPLKGELLFADRVQRLTIAREQRTKALAAVSAEKAREVNPGSRFLTQAGFEGGTASAQVSIDAAHLFFRNGRTRFHLRSTLPTDIDTSTAPTDALEDRIKAALSDPYGGLLYLSVGELKPICLAKVTRDACKEKTKSADGDGFYLDLRAGAKFVQLPGEVTGGVHKATAFGVMSGGIRIRQSLWIDNSATHPAGVFELSAQIVVNRAIDRSVSPLTAAGGELAGWPTGLNVAIGLGLVDNVALTLRGAPWTNKPLSRDFAIGISLLK